CKGFPQEFVTYLTYCRNLRFEDKPDYSHCKQLFKDLFIRSGFEYDYIYDWNLLSDKKKPDDEPKSKLSTSHLQSSNFVLGGSSPPGKNGDLTPPAPKEEAKVKASFIP